MQNLIEIINANIQIILIVLLVLFVVIFGFQLILYFKLKSFLKGTGEVSLEKALNKITSDYTQIKQNQEEIEKFIKNLDVEVKKTIKGVGLVKFNPFAGSGDSKPSFALALISSNGDGIIISNLYARDSVSFFTKEIKNFNSSAELSKEEAEALAKAKNSLHN